MRRKWAALALCLLLVVQLVGVPATATGSVYFVGAEENILPLSDSTMPFWKDNYLYIPSTIFTGAPRDSLKVGSSQSSDGSWVALYWGNRALLFKKDSFYAEDQDGRRYYPGAIERNGILFVPVGVVADFFDLKYSVKSVARGHLVWLRTQDFILTEETFADAAAGVMEQRYVEYFNEKNQPSNPLPDVPGMSEEPIISGKRLYLCARANDGTAVLLDLLERYNSYMTFFCTPDFLAEQDDLLRRMVGSGHGIGILAEVGENLPSALEQVQQGNLALEQATGSKTRLVRVENGTAETISELLTAGYCSTAAELKLSQYTLRNSNQAELLFRSMVADRSTAVVWLGEEIQSSGLVTFMSRAVWADDPCMPLTETVHLS